MPLTIADPHHCCSGLNPHPLLLDTALLAQSLYCPVEEISSYVPSYTQTYSLTQGMVYTSGGWERAYLVVLNNSPNVEVSISNPISYPTLHIHSLAPVGNGSVYSTSK